MSETYAPTLCSKCFSDNHEDCDGVARIQVNGDPWFGQCRCRCRNTFNRGKYGRTNQSQSTGLTPAAAAPDPMRVEELHKGTDSLEERSLVVRESSGEQE